MGQGGFDFDSEEEDLIAQSLLQGEINPDNIYLITLNLKRHKSVAKMLHVPKDHRKVTGKHILFSNFINN